MPKRSQHVPEYYAEYQEALAKQIGARIRQRRLELGLTQEALRSRMELNSVCVSRSQHSRMENGQRLPSAAEIIALTATLGVSCDWLLSGAGEREEA